MIPLLGFSNSQFPLQFPRLMVIHFLHLVVSSEWIHIKQILFFQSKPQNNKSTKITYKNRPQQIKCNRKRSTHHKNWW